VATLTPAKFVAKWKPVQLPERAASQEFFLDLCHLLGQPTPAEHDPTGEEYAFEKGVAVSAGASKGAAGRHGFADAWWRGKFAWEFKRRDKHKTLDDAYRQLQQYREALENPPLLIVCDIQRIEIHTNFTGTKKEVHRIDLEDLAEPASLDLLRRTFESPRSLKPDQTPEQVTKIVAEQIATLAHRLRGRGHDPHDAAHFLMKCMFCLFAEDVGLLPADRFKKLAEQGLDALRTGKADEAKVRGWFTELFDAMREGGFFWGEAIAHFNGGLFDEAPALELTADELAILVLAAGQDWASVEPAIFGTLFERSLDPQKRSQIGAHYTSREDILLIVEPVVMAPLRRDWDEVRERIEQQIERRQKAATGATKKKADDEIGNLLDGFLRRLASVRILDPACGSGNFLYVAIQQLLGLEKAVITFAAGPEIGQGLFPHVRPTQLRGVEISPYAAELAQVVIWIGYLQWMRDNGFQPPRDPILEPLTTIEHKDAILDLSDPETPRVPEWPEADFIIGNPPFLGSRKARIELGDRYVDAYQTVYRDALPEGADLCCYWFELARRESARNPDLRVGLLATQAIRMGSSRVVIDRIIDDATIFFAISNRKWILEGASVRISMIGFARDAEDDPILNGKTVERIYADLTGDLDLTQARALSDNRDLTYQGTIKSGAFDIDWREAMRLLASPTVGQRSNADVLRPWVNGRDLTARRRGMWIVDFGTAMQEEEAATYEGPFEYVKHNVKPERDTLNKDGKPKYAHSSVYPFWRLWNTRHDLRAKLATRERYLATPRVSKHRLFTWLESSTLPDARVVAVATERDDHFGVLSSSLHAIWAHRVGTRHGVAGDITYNHTVCFETFPLPWAPGDEPGAGEDGHDLLAAIGEAARELDEQRERWLNPPEWIDRIAKAVDLAEDFGDVPEEARGLLRRSAIMAAAAKDKRLKQRTLTNLYNERPTWLRLAHRRLDEAVLAAYACTDPAGGWDPSWAAAYEPCGAGIITDGKKDSEETRAAKERAREARGETDEKILGGLLRLNQERAG